MAGIINPANIFTSTRLVVLPLVVYAAYKNYSLMAVTIIAYSGVVDMLDGFVARKFNCASRFGEMLDAISDASLFLVGLLAAVAFKYSNPVPAFLLLGLGAINAAGRVIFIKKTGVITNFRSYASEVLGGFTFWVLVAQYLDWYADAGLWLLSFFTFVVIIHDYYRILTYPVDLLKMEEAKNE